MLFETQSAAIGDCHARIKRLGGSGSRQVPIHVLKILQGRHPNGAALLVAADFSARVGNTPGKASCICGQVELFGAVIRRERRVVFGGVAGWKTQRIGISFIRLSYHLSSEVDRISGFALGDSSVGNCLILEVGFRREDEVSCISDGNFFFRSVFEIAVSTLSILLCNLLGRHGQFFSLLLFKQSPDDSDVAKHRDLVLNIRYG